jgi:phosphoenolpyruvate-protein phosphotransferase (PTS system enzyme I)
LSETLFVSLANMLQIRGIPVSSGIAIGPAFLLDAEGVRIPQKLIEASKVESEIERFRDSLRAAKKDSQALQNNISDRLGKQYGAIFSAHAMLFEDPSLTGEIETLIRRDLYAPEYALSRVIRNYVRLLEGLGTDSVFSLRSADLYDVEKRLLNLLLGDRREPLQELTQPVIVLAHDLSPSQTASLDPEKVWAFVCEHGGRASHTAILANALEIPAVVGLGKFLNEVSGGDLVIVDGTSGQVILDPDADTVDRYRSMLDQRKVKTNTLWLQEKDKPAVTKDGTPITLLGNIEFPAEAEQCLLRGAKGVGLYRTEFLYLGRDKDPSEEEHFQAYLSVLKQLGPEQPVVIRTLDLGADKFAAMAYTGDPEKNPSLGLRSVRLCLRNLPLFRTQLRAVLRASHFGDIRVMFPMVGTLLELRQCKMLLAEVKEDLEYEGIPFHRNIPIGTMIEVPSAALMADYLAREVDFFSIGTNDLVQYTLAADRTNENVANLYNPADPAVLRLIDMVAKAANLNQIGVNVCGEMSGDPLFTQLLLGMGMRQFSVTPHGIPELKRLIRMIDLTEAKAIAAEAITLETATNVTNYLNNQLRRILPEAID